MNIYEVPNDRRYWVVRAEGGKYYDHFTRNGIIALGHVNCLNFPDTPKDQSFQPDELIIAEDLRKHHKGKNNKKQTASAHLAQVKYFIYGMTAGDWVITVGYNSVRFGRVTGNAYIRKEPVTVIYDPESGRKVEMDHHLRRAVTWGPSLPRRSLPYGLLRALKANQTVFCLDKNWQAIYHSLYPAFRKDDKLYLSAKINSEDNIKNQSVTALFNLLNEIEVIGKEFTLGNDIEDFDETLSSYIDEDRLSITTKAQFHSPGEIWNTISGLAGAISLDSWATYTVAAYSMLFGNNKLGFDGIIDIDTRKKLWDLIIERVKANKAENVVKSLKLEMPNTNTEALDNQDNNKEQP